MSKKILNKIAKQYSTFQMEGAEMLPAETKHLTKLIEEDFKAGFTSAIHIMSKDAERMSMLMVILDQHFNAAEEVNLEEVGRAVGICFRYI